MPGNPVDSGTSALASLVPHAPRIAMALCLCLLVAEAVDMLWGNLHGGAGTTATRANAGRAGQPDARRAHSAQLASILRANLFGAAPGVDAPLVTADDLLLTGTFASDDPAQGFAMLGKAADHIAVVRVGAATPDGAVLREVYPDRVVIERDGVLMALALVRRNPQAGGAWTPVALMSVDAATIPAASPAVMRAISFTPPGIPPGLSFGSRFAMERDARPPDLSLVPPPRALPPDQLEPPQRLQNH